MELSQSPAIRNLHVLDSVLPGTSVDLMVRVGESLGMWNRRFSGRGVNNGNQTYAHSLPII
jgi:hypothetical protein